MKKKILSDKTQLQAKNKMRLVKSKQKNKNCCLIRPGRYIREKNAF